jgi:ribosomal protein S6E (S10)
MSAQGKETGFKFPKHNNKMSFYNQDGDEVGVLDFNGAHLTFEGNADESAIVFMDNISTVFQYRLQLEYNKGYKAGKDFTQKKTSG